MTKDQAMEQEFESLSPSKDRCAPQKKNSLFESGFSQWVDSNFKLINILCFIGITIAAGFLVVLLINDSLY